MLNLTTLQLCLVTLLLTHITIISVTVYLHRHQAHRALELHPLVAHFFRAWLWLTTGIKTKEWAAVHRLHHAKCEKEGDPHSPQVLGLKKVFFKGYWLYQSAASNPQTLSRYGVGCPEDWIEKNLYSKYSRLGIGLMLTVNVMLFGWAGVLMWAVQMLWIPTWAAGVINGIAHYVGYRNFDPKDASRNISPLGIWIGGEELHNNHHTYPASAKLSVKPYEIDIGWGYIRLLEILGLAKAKKLPPKAYFEQKAVPNGGHPSLEKLQTVVELRFELMAQFAKALRKAYIEEQKQQKELIKISSGKWRRLELAKIGLESQVELEKLAAQSEVMNKLIGLRESLVKIWADSKLTKEECMAQLQAWFEQAQKANHRQVDQLLMWIYRVKALPTTVDKA